MDNISRFVTHEIILYLCQKTSESQQRQIYCHPKTVIFHREIVLFPFKNGYITLVYNFSAHLLLWVRNLKSQLFFEMQPVTKIKCQNKVCNSFIKTQRKCKCVINEEIVAIATVIVMKRINVNLYREKKIKTKNPLFRNFSQPGCYV